LNGPKSHNPQGKVKQKFFREWELFEEVTNQVGQILSKHIIYHRHTHCINIYMRFYMYTSGDYSGGRLGPVVPYQQLLLLLLLLPLSGVPAAAI